MLIFLYTNFHIGLLVSNVIGEKKKRTILFLVELQLCFYTYLHFCSFEGLESAGCVWFGFQLCLFDKDVFYNRCC